MSFPALTIIGERINSSRQGIARAIEDKDEEFIQREARMQREAGAAYLDVNAGTFPGREAEYLPWLVRAVRACVDAPLSLDSSDPKALEAALRECHGAPLINSISLEKEKMDAILPLVLERRCGVIAQTLESGHVPDGARERLDIAIRLADALTGAGIMPENIYIDPVVEPVSMDNKAGAETLEAFGAIRERLPDVHILCGVGNVSFQLPRRSLLDRTFLAMAMAAGADAAIIDPCNNDIMTSVAAAETLLGRDEFCMRYISAHREGTLGTTE